MSINEIKLKIPQHENFHRSHVQTEIFSLRSNESVLQWRRKGNSPGEHFSKESKIPSEVQKNTTGTTYEREIKVVEKVFYVWNYISRRFHLNGLLQYCQSLISLVLKEIFPYEMVDYGNIFTTIEANR